MHPAETWRLFVALPIPDSVRRAIESLQVSWRFALPRNSVRWTNCDQLHLTLKFLGDVEADRVPALTNVLADACRASTRIHLVAQGAGVFPNERSPRVLWVGVSDARGGLSRLQQAVETATAGFGQSKSAGSFSSHVTLGRVRDGASSISGMVKNLVSDAADRKFGEWTAAAIELVQSELSAAGARHRCLSKLPLGGELSGT